MAAAAEAAGVGYSTLRRWMKEDTDFRAEYDSMMISLVEDAALQARQSMTPAVTALREIVDDDSVNGAVRVQAARSLLEYGLKITERVDVLERLDALEIAAEQFWE